MDELSSSVAAQIRSLEEAHPLREPTLREAIAALALPLGARGLDVGCGIGLSAMMLAESTRGPVTGLDLSAGLLAHARSHLAGHALAGHLSFVQGDLTRLPFADGAFDWAVSVDCVGYPAGDILPALQEMARVVRPGGTVAILGWTSQKLLPGHPLLEAELESTCSAYAPFFRGKSPEAHFTRALARLSEAGIMEGIARTFVGQVQAPLGAEIRTALLSLFEMLWILGPGTPEPVRRDHERICRPGSPDFILDAPGYQAFFTYTMFSGAVSK